MTLLSSRVHQVFPGPVAKKFDALASLGSAGVAIESALRRVLLEVGTDDDWSVICAFSAKHGVEVVYVVARMLARAAMVTAADQTGSEPLLEVPRGDSRRPLRRNTARDSRGHF